MYSIYEKIDAIESELFIAKDKKETIESDKLTGDKIYKVLIYFDKLCSLMDEVEKRQLMESLISEVNIYEERKENGQWLKTIKFKFATIDESIDFSSDSNLFNETLVLLEKQKS